MKNKQFLILFSLLVFLGILLFLKKSFPEKENDRNQKNNITQECGIENCHGLEIQCGSEIPEFCTAIYQTGDICRQFASCEIQNNQCQLKKNPLFDQCKLCIENCLAKYSNDPVKLSTCESDCVPFLNGQD